VAVPGDYFNVGMMMNAADHFPADRTALLPATSRSR
jgi:hypothetical protein